MTSQAIFLGLGWSKPIGLVPRAPRRRVHEANEALLAPLLSHPDQYAQGVELARCLPWEEAGRSARWALTLEAWRAWEASGIRVLDPPQTEPLRASDWPLPSGLACPVDLACHRDGSVSIGHSLASDRALEIVFLRFEDRLEAVRFRCGWRPKSVGFAPLRWGAWNGITLRPRRQE